jgi:hypothetical protein
MGSFTFAGVSTVLIASPILNVLNV